MAAYAIIGDTLMYVCLCGLIVCGSALALAAAVAPVWDLLKSWFGQTGVQKVLVAVFAVGLIQYAATKSRVPVVRYDGGIKAGATSNLITNDFIHIAWQRDLSGGIYVPESAAVYIDYRPYMATNEQYGLLAQTTVGAWSWEGVLPDATNYDFNVWAYYVPPEPVHTNGVWVYKTLKDRAGKYAIPLRARIEINGKAIATPAEKRKDEE